MKKLWVLFFLLVCICFYFLQSRWKEDTVYIATGFFQGPYAEKGKREISPLFGYYLPEIFQPYQLKIKTIKSYKKLPKAKKIILFDLISCHNLKALSLFPKAKLSLFLWEPPSTVPENYDKKSHELFSRIYTWDDDLVDNKKYFKLYSPDAKEMIPNPLPFEEKKFSTLVCRNKKSSHPQELYSERKKVIEFFEQNALEDFDLYGEGWEAAGFKTYKGAPATKECLREYKFNFAYENIHHVRGYITEKIFESFHYGCVPIYWGAENVADYIPDNCYIDRRKFASNEELYCYLKSIKEEEYALYLENIRQFLKSEKAKLFTPKKFIEIFKDAAGLSE